MQISHDSSLALLCIKRLRNLYPGSKVICILENSSNIFRKLKYYGVKIHRGEPLYKYDKNASVVLRKFKLFAECNSEYFFKIDPDTHFHKRITKLPITPCMFGNKTRAQRSYIIQGGCMGYNKEIIIKALQEKFFEKINIDNDRGWIRPGRVLGMTTYEYFKKYDRVSYDMISKYAMDKLGYPLVQHEEIYSVWLPNLNSNKIYNLHNYDKIYSVTHPCLERVKRDLK